jgi:uncharacterized coiled-coil DUF342 family protein
LMFDEKDCGNCSACEIRSLKAKLMAVEKERDELLATSDADFETKIEGCMVLRDVEYKELTAKLAAAEKERAEVQKLVAAMHAAAMGEVRGPKRGVVEDVADLRKERDEAREDLQIQTDNYRGVLVDLEAARKEMARLRAALESVVRQKPMNPSEGYFDLTVSVSEFKAMEAALAGGEGKA